MGVRLVLILIAGLAALAGFGLVALNLAAGETARAIAYGWPLIGLALTLGLAVPAGTPPLQARGTGGLKKGA